MNQQQTFCLLRGVRTHCPGAAPRKLPSTWGLRRRNILLKEQKFQHEVLTDVGTESK